MRRTMRLVRFGILTSAIAGAVWWALQRRQDQQSTPLGRAAEPSGATGGDGDRPSGAGSRGSHPSEERGSRSDEIVDLSQAAKVLEVDESRIPVLVEGGLLEPLGGSGSGSSMRFRRSEVEAVRLQGG